MNFAKMLKQAQAMQEAAQRIQAELASREFEGQSGGGAVRAIARGDFTLVSLSIDPDFFGQADRELLEDLIVTAVREAMEKAKNETHQALSKLAGGNIPPGLLGG
ncbi:YbaB/EbfC family nucleoid-associated protein [Candidatus Methylacidithermus pantelleriae]|uniref:Nucleoid-associated protein MPNT_220046 n=1 Tax=Candidatus Methylacidithermus pantelleriae TaxID=2744239 RepID=A0A8J2BIH1_9BACT|nr:YbaB/EbfC family nucleoid-associated protein [Candidatus Methylacidithermus pantelleriae]CAF0697575.1 Nucleoid-associated protein Minf_1672 [Candidatus Methylacidithermus pantelleriae]